MKIGELINDETKRKLTKLARKKNKRKEKLTKRDILYLMDVNRDIYQRAKGGAWRRK